MWRGGIVVITITIILSHDATKTSIMADVCDKDLYDLKISKSQIILNLLAKRNQQKKGYRSLRLEAI